MVIAVYLSTKSNNRLGVSHVLYSENSLGFRDSYWCFSNHGFKASVQAAKGA